MNDKTCSLCRKPAVVGQWETVDKGTAQQREKLMRYCETHMRQAGLEVRGHTILRVRQ